MPESLTLEDPKKNRHRLTSKNCHAPRLTPSRALLPPNPAGLLFYSAVEVWLRPEPLLRRASYLKRLENAVRPLQHTNRSRQLPITPLRTRLFQPLARLLAVWPGVRQRWHMILENQWKSRVRSRAVPKGRLPADAGSHLIRGTLTCFGRRPGGKKERRQLCRVSRWRLVSQSPPGELRACTHPHPRYRMDDRFQT
jgi:hypothetical protein